MNKKIISIIVIFAFIILLVIFAINYNRLAKENTKFQDFKHHYEDSIEQRRDSFTPQ
jgi:hypothetical protein